MTEEKNNHNAVAFGRYLRSLRKRRGLSYEILAKRSGLAEDTIRGLERGDCKPDFATLRKLAGGLNMKMSALFTEFELGERERLRELTELLAGRSSRELQFAVKLLRFAFAELEAAREDDEDDEDDTTGS
ncbi:anaerobic benzoate catabolism transcriptional regulator [Enhygromyxa salina]|uniref:Anaerobic benzoate catabolism transcriptional regulator n=1 Tax=Enhygromyxa salina TaxID=215803 RepID=A0A2S9YGP9_9BACT|nr:helix-turn-helix transcriptional regulator [Enhygromyxa salina]PRQ04293.1 anaerobic benzoate catabolism transcriptional regulator [Enhygromyxa salina]